MLIAIKEFFLAVARFLILYVSYIHDSHKIRDCNVRETSPLGKGRPPDQSLLWRAEFDTQRCSTTPLTSADDLNTVALLTLSMLELSYSGTPAT